MNETTIDSNYRWIELLKRACEQERDVFCNDGRTYLSDKQHAYMYIDWFASLLFYYVSLNSFSHNILFVHTIICIFVQSMYIFFIDYCSSIRSFWRLVENSRVLKRCCCCCCYRCCVVFFPFFFGLGGYY